MTNPNLIRLLRDPIRRYRYDIFAALLTGIVVFWLILSLSDGRVVFDDPEVPQYTNRLMDGYVGPWNERLSTTNEPGLARLLLILIPFLLSALAGFDGAVFTQSSIAIIVVVAAGSMFLLSRWFFTRYVRDDFALPGTLSISAASILYVVNPWFLIRIDHFYPIFAYALLPLFFYYLLNAFDWRIDDDYPILKPTYRLRARKILDLAGAAATATLLSVAPNIAIVTWGISIVTIVCATIRAIVVSRHHRHAIVIRTTKKSLILFILFAGLSWFWIGPLLHGDSGRPPIASPNVDLDQLAVQSRDSSLPRVLLAISDPDGVTRPGALPIIGGLAMLVLILLGIYQRSRHLLLVLPPLFGVLLVLAAMGTKSVLTAGIYANLALSNAITRTVFGDPSLFLGFLILIYAIFFSFGLYYLLKIKSTPGWALVGRSIVVVVAAFSIAAPIMPVLALKAERRNHSSPVSGSIEPLFDRIPDSRVMGIRVGSGTDRELALDLSRHGLIDTITDGGTEDGRSQFYARFLSSLLVRGASRDVPSYIAPLAVEEVVLSPGAISSDLRALLDVQEGWSFHGESGRYLHYVIDPVASENAKLPRLIYSSRGLATRPAIDVLTESSSTRFVYLYSHNETEASIRHVRSGDLLEVASFNELWLSNLDDELYIDPTVGISEGNPYLGWDRMSLYGERWDSMLGVQGIERTFDFDMGAGVVATTTSVSLSIPPYARENLHGRLVMDDEAMRRLGTFFTADRDPKGFSVDAYNDADRESTTTFIAVPSLSSGGIVVASSGFIEVDMSTPYKFELHISGEGVKELEMLVRFFDSEFSETGSVVPLQPVRPDRDFFRLVGIYTSSPDARYVRIELRSKVPAFRPTRWWIHGFSLFDLSEYRRANTLEVDFVPGKRESHRVYARVFLSERGGEISFVVGESESIFETQTPGGTGFVWREIGNFELDEPLKIQIRNISGFNAVSRIAVIPDSRYGSSRFIIRRGIDKTIPFFALEAERAFEYSGHTQTSRRYPDLSMGAGIASADGTLTRVVEIVKSGRYAVLLREAGDRNRSTVTVELTDENGDVTSRRAKLLAVIPSVASRTYLNGSTIGEHANALPDLQLVMLGPFDLGVGRYELEISLRSNTSNLATIYGLRAFDPHSIGSGSETIIDSGLDCSTCEAVDASMMRHSFANGVLKISYDPGCSCDWYVYSSPSIGVVADDEYLVRFDARSEFLHEGHAKIVFLDEANHLIGYDELPAQRDDSMWSAYEHIASVPDGANRMLFQIWGRGDRTRVAKVEMKELSILPFKDLPLIDSVYVIHEGALSLLSGDGDEPIRVDITESGDGLRRQIYADGTIANPVLIELDLPSASVWRSFDSTPQVALDGVRAGYFATAQELSVTAGCRRCYYSGYVFFALSLVLVLVLYLSARSGNIVWNRSRLLLTRFYDAAKRSMANLRFRFPRSRR